MSRIIEPDDMDDQNPAMNPMSDKTKSELEELLSAIEQRAEAATPVFGKCRCRACKTWAENRALVKALRRLIQALHHTPSIAYKPICQNIGLVELVPNDLQAEADTAMQDVTAILKGQS